MNLLSCYGLTAKRNLNTALDTCLHQENRQDQTKKLISTVKQLFKDLSVTIISPQLSTRNQIKMPFDSFTFSLLHDSKAQQYQYLFQVEVNMQRHLFKITATIMKQGRIINIYKQGITQMLANYFLHINNVSNYSTRIDPFIGTIKLTYTTHSSKNQMQQTLKYPVQFTQGVKVHIKDMVERLDQRLLGRIFFLTNQYPLKSILPQNYQCIIHDCSIEILTKTQSPNSLYRSQTLPFYYIIDKKLKQIRRDIANSTIKYPFFSKDSIVNKIRFWPQIVTKKKQLQKEQKSARHNIKILPFSKEVKNILNYYTSTIKLIQQQYEYKNGGDSSWLEPTQEEIKNIYISLDCQSIRKHGKTLNDITIQSVDNQTFICSGGFAQISYLTVTKLSKNEKTSEVTKSKQCLIKKKAGRQKLYWQNQIINRIGPGSCLFINKYYKIQINPQSINLSKNMFENCIFMEYCSFKSLNNYMSRMNSIISVKNKIFWLYQVSVGLRFLRDLGVVHLDMKPENLLIKVMSNGPNNAFTIIKIIDFGEAYCQSLLNNQKLKRGHTCPYAPPEFVKKTEEKLTQKSDIFSLGVMILILIFDMNAIDIKRLTSSAIFNSKDQYIKLYSMCVQRCRYFGCQPIMQCLLNLAYKCISQTTSSRPFLNWVSVVLKNLSHLYQHLQRGRS